jgi:hypothetical protein
MIGQLACVVNRQSNTPIPLAHVTVKLITADAANAHLTTFGGDHIVHDIARHDRIITPCRYAVMLLQLFRPQKPLPNFFNVSETHATQSKSFLHKVRIVFRQLCELRIGFAAGGENSLHSALTATTGAGARCGGGGGDGSGAATSTSLLFLRARARHVFC